MTDEETVVAGELEDDAEDAASPSSDEETTSPPDDREKVLRDRLSAVGRESSRLRQENESLKSQLIQLQQQVMSISQKLQEEERKRWEAYIASLPPAEQALERVKLLEHQQRQTAQAVAVPAAREDPIAYKNRRMREIIKQVNEEFGLRGEYAIAGDEVELDDSTEQAFIASAYKLAAKGVEEMSRRKSVSKAPLQDNSREDLVEAAARKALEALGVGSPLSTRSTSRPKEVTPEDVREALWGYSPQKGPSVIRKKLEDLRERLK